MSYIYHGEKPTLRERVGNFIGGKATQKDWQAGSPFPADPIFTGTGLQATWFESTPQNYIKEGYRKNSAIIACIGVWATAFREPSMRMYDRVTDKEIPNHPVTLLFERPNELMGQDEFWNYLMTYKCIGGNTYTYKLRSKAGKVVELWPYHFGRIKPIPSELKWVDHYAYDMGAGQVINIDKNDIMHTKWPLPDPDKPWMAMSPMEPIAREIAIDNELTRFVKATLENDAIVRTALKMPVNAMALTPKQREDMRRDFVRMHGGDKRGGVAILENGMDIVRMSLSFQEFQADSLRDADEARIASAFLVPPQLAYLKVGMDHMIYNSFAEARYAFTHQALVPMWKQVAAEVQSCIVPEFDDPTKVYAAFDLTEVEALRNQNWQTQRVVLDAGFKGFGTINEIRASFGWPPIDDGDRMIDVNALSNLALGQAVIGQGSDDDAAYTDGDSTESDAAATAAGRQAGSSVRSGGKAGTGKSRDLDRYIINSFTPDEYARLLTMARQGAEPVEPAVLESGQL